MTEKGKEARPAQRRTEMVTLIMQALKKDLDADRVVFKVTDLTKNKLLSDIDTIEVTLDKIHRDLGADFVHKVSYREGVTSAVADVNRKTYRVPEFVTVYVEDRKRFEQYALEFGRSNIPRFDPDKSRLYVSGKEIKIRKFTDQYHTLRVIFEDPKEMGKEWFFSELVEKIDQHKPNEKRYYNALNQVRYKLVTAGFPDFFVTTTQSVKIRPKYLS